VRLRFRHDVAHRVQARHHRNLRIDATTDDGDLLATVTCGQDKHGLPIDLLPWIYAFGPGVEVLAPARVRDHVARELRDAADAYDHTEPHWVLWRLCSHAACLGRPCS
jgi:predicted DNA-binding transcriptional regulator YafY